MIVALLIAAAAYAFAGDKFTKYIGDVSPFQGRQRHVRRVLGELVAGERISRGGDQERDDHRASLTSGRSCSITPPARARTSDRTAGRATSQIG